jgi:hypothetical protein
VSKFVSSSGDFDSDGSYFGAATTAARRLRVGVLQV